MRTHSANAMIPGSSSLSIVRHHQDPCLLYVIPCTHLALDDDDDRGEYYERERDRANIISVIYIKALIVTSCVWCTLLGPRNTSTPLPRDFLLRPSPQIGRRGEKAVLRKNLPNNRRQLHQSALRSSLLLAPTSIRQPRIYRAHQQF